MCGILAIHLRNQQRDLDKIYEGWEMLSNRGPDDGSLTISKDFIMGFKRLSIIDTSSRGNQPFECNDAQLICNGEIYNHKYLEDIYNISCTSGSDCECIVRLFFKLSWVELVGKLNGDFAIVLTHRNKIFFARDRIGVRPLFMGITHDGNFALASYARVLASYCRDIKQVPPGWGEYDCISSKIKLNSFKLPLTPVFMGDNQRGIRELLIKATEDRLMSDRPVGCLLSGGLDSSLITSIVCSLRGPKNVRTYSIGMEGSQDLKYARQVAEYLGTEHTEVKFTPMEGFEAIPYIIRDLESYDITTIRASVGMWLLAKYISENSEDIVLLSGEGADELFCGYLYFHYAPTPLELEQESSRLVRELYMYDVLRADRCVSSHGLELRVPFLDRRLVDVALSLPGTVKCPLKELKTFQGDIKIEKFLLRSAFATGKYLPPEILWRRKDGMSDGVSGNTGKKWYEQIQDFVDECVTDQEFEKYKDKFPFKEAYYYKKIFDKIFPIWQPEFNYWLPRWVDHGGDPSGRNLDIFKKTKK